MKTLKVISLVFTVLVCGVNGQVAAIKESVFIERQYQYQQKSQTIQAVYYTQKGLKNILIRVKGNYVVGYCLRKDYQGRQIWNDISPVSIDRNRGISDVVDPNLTNVIRIYEYSAKIGDSMLFFNL